MDDRELAEPRATCVVLLEHLGAYATTEDLAHFARDVEHALEDDDRVSAYRSNVSPADARWEAVGLTDLELLQLVDAVWGGTLEEINGW